MNIIDKSLFRPVKRDHINQPFGVNYCEFYKQMGMLGHNGVDFEAHNGDEVYFNFRGKGEVISVCDSWTKGLGITIIIQDGGKYFKILFWHLKGFAVKEGQVVETGQLLGYADNSGMSTGDHLHFGVYRCDQFGNTLNKDNGYGGAIDPTPYYRNYFVGDVMESLGKQVGLLQKLVELVKKLLSGRK